MGRRLIMLLALSVAAGVLARLAPAQDGAPPPAAEASQPPPEVPPADALAPPTDIIPMPVPPKAAARPNAAKAGPARPSAPPAPTEPPAANPAAAPEPTGDLPAAAMPAVLPGGGLSPAQDSEIKQSQNLGLGNNAAEVNPLPPAKDRAGQAAPNVPPTEADEFILPPERLQMGRQSVGLTVEVIGPPRLNLNTTATYRIVVKNGGMADAANVVVRDKLPDGLVFESSKPEAQRVGESILVWQLGSVPGGGERPIEVKVKPTKTGELDHAATVSMRAGAKTRTRVYEPKLKVEQSAPAGKILKGRPVEFKIVVTNVGDGVARRVMVRANLSRGLHGGVSDDDDVTAFELPLGDLPPGERVALDPLVADTVGGGGQSCTVIATSPDVAFDEATAKNTQAVEVIEPGLQMTFTGPKERFTDMISAYTITLDNPGTATARNVRASARLPIGAQFVRATPNAQFDPSRRQVNWESIQIEPGGKDRPQLTFEVRTSGPGPYTVVAEAVGENRLRDSKDVTTQVKAVADLDLEITEDRRVVDVGELATLNVRVTNRGSKDATTVLIRGEHTPNLEVKQTAGTETAAERDPDNKPSFTFPVIERLARGATIVLRIQVKAKSPGKASCRIFLKHDDELDQEDVARFLVTTHVAAP